MARPITEKIREEIQGEAMSDRGSNHCPDASSFPGKSIAGMAEAFELVL